MAWKATIAGVDRTSYIHTPSGVSISRPLNERATARFSLLPGLSPSRFAEVVIYSEDGTTKLFGGVIVRRSVRGLQQRFNQPSMSCECADYSIYGSWRYATLSYDTAHTLEAVLTDLVDDYLSDYGVTLDPTQLTGPTIAPFSWSRKNILDGLRELSDRTGWVFRFDADKKLKMFEPGTEASSVSISDAAPNCEDITYDDSTAFPSTRVTGVFGPSGVGGTPFVHSWEADGIVGEFSLAGLNVPASSEWPSVAVDGTPYPIWPVGAAPGGDGIEWDHATDGGTLSFVGSATSLIPDGAVVTLTYLPLYPFVVSDTTGGSPEIERVLPPYPDVLVYAEALEIIAQKKAEGDQQPRIFRITSRAHGWTPGTSLPIEHSARNISATSGSITQVELSLSSVLEWTYTVTAQETEVIQASELPVGAWREMLGGRGGGGGGSSTVVSGGGVGGGGTDGKLARWFGADTIGESIISESGGAITIDGAVDATALTVATVPVLTTGAIGATVQAYSANLAAVAGITTNTRIPYVAAGALTSSAGLTYDPAAAMIVNAPGTIPGGGAFIVNANTGTPPSVTHPDTIHLIGGDNGGPGVMVTAYGLIDPLFGTATRGTINLRAARGTMASPEANQADDELGRFGIRGHTGTAFTGAMAAISMFAAENVTATDQGAYIVFRTNALGEAVPPQPAERMRLSPSGGLLIGDSTHNAATEPGGGSAKLEAALTVGTTLNVGGITTIGTSLVATTDALQVWGADANAASATITRSQANNAGAVLRLRKDRSASAIVQSGDTVGQMLFLGWDGASAYSNAAAITGAIDGTPGVGDMPGRLGFWTTPDGSATQVENLRITQEGHLALNAAKRVYFDGVGAAGNTYLVESSADTLDAVVGGVTALSLTSTTATFVANAIGWTAVNKTGSSLADLATRSAADLSSGILPDARMPDLTGDVTTSEGAVATTLATVNANVGSFGSSTAIPSFTVNAKGLITAASTNAVVAPAGTLTGTTLASNVVTSSLTSVGTLTGGATGAGFTVALGSSTITGDLEFANLTQGSALSVLGVAGNATADHASIAAGTDHFVLRRSGTALGFGLLTNNNIDAAANIALSKIAGTNDRIPYVASSVLTSSANMTFNGTAFTVTGTGSFSGAVGIGTASPSRKLDVVLDDATNNGSVSVLGVFHTTTGTAAAGIGARILLGAEDAAGSLVAAARIGVVFTDVTSGSSTGEMHFDTTITGSIAERMRLTSTALRPASNDGSALGTSTVSWADLFLASGGVLNWNNGDVTVTHAANSLAFAGASSGYSFDALVNANGGIAVDGTAFTVADTTGNTAIAGTLQVTGATTLTGALAANGGITVDSTNFTVSGTTGAVHTAGDFDVATNKFTVAAASGNTAIGGTLGVTGASSFTGLIGHPSYASQTTNWRITAAGAADFRNVFTDELHAKVFVADLEQALAGGQIISKSVAILSRDFTVPAAGGSATLWVWDLPSAANMAVFESGDTVVLRSFSRAAGSLTIAEAVGVVTSYSDGTGEQSWTFTRNAGANGGGLAGSTVITADSLALDFGVTGNGYYEVNAIDGAYGANSPYAQVVTWATSPIAANRTVRARFGKLDGITTETDEYGLIAGVYAATDGQYFRASNEAFELHGIDLTMWDGADEVFMVRRNAGAPYLSLGATPPTAYGANAGVFLGWSGTAAQMSLYADANNYLQYDGTKLTWKAANTTLDGSGNLTATSATLTGAITANSGYIGGTGGWVIGTGLLSATRVKLGSDGADGYLGLGATPPTSYGNNVGVFLGSNGTSPARVSVYADANNYLQWDGSKLLVKAANVTIDSSGNLTASSATLSGAITATSGSIGSFTIGTYLYTGSKTAWNDANAGVHIGSDGIGIGNNVFTVNGSTGALVATSATISGTVTATAGAIGGFDIGADYIRDAANSFGLSSTVTGGDDVRFWAGDTFANRATADFRLTESGALTANNATITSASGTVTIGSGGIKVAAPSSLWDANASYSFTPAVVGGAQYGLMSWEVGGGLNERYLALDNVTGIDAYTAVLLRADNASGHSKTDGSIQVISHKTTTGSGSQIIGDAYSISMVAGGGGLVLEGDLIRISGATRYTAEISPAALSADTHNWNPTDFSTSRFVRLTVTGPISLTGMAAQPDGFEFTLMNFSPDDVTLPHESGSSTAANRWALPGGLDLNVNQYRAYRFRMDGTIDRWVLVS